MIIFTKCFDFKQSNINSSTAQGFNVLSLKIEAEIYVIYAYLNKYKSFTFKRK